MKMKKILAVLMLAVALVSCNQKNDVNNINNTTDSLAAIPENGDIDQAITDSLNLIISSNISNELTQKRTEITKEAFATIFETQNLLNTIDNGDTAKAIEMGHKLIGKLEVLLTKSPDAKLILVNVDLRKNEIISDINTVRNTVKLAKDAFDKGYYQVASDLLKNLKSEMIIRNYYIPTATYPDAIKMAVAKLEEGDSNSAKLILEQVLNTVVIDENIIPLPVLRAEQLIALAANIDKKDHNNAKKVVNLLNEANYQLQLAQEMGYGKKDEDFKNFADMISKLKESVNNKQDSQSSFDSLKNNISNFKNKLFSEKHSK